MTGVRKMLYLHGLGSGPESRKARLIGEHFTTRGYKVALPSISLPSLEELSPQAAVLFVSEEIKASLKGEFVLIGSSFGAFVANHALRLLHEEERLRVAKCVLIAPLFDPWDTRGGLLTPDRERVWREKGTFPIMDLGKGREVSVHYRFVEELRELSVSPISYEVSTLIVHGAKDEVVPVSQSREFSSTRPWVRLEIFEDTHQLLKDPEALLAVLEGFILSENCQSR